MKSLCILALSATLMAGFALATVAQNSSVNNYPLGASELSAKIAAHAQLTDVPTIYIDIPGITTEDELSQQLYKDRNNNYAPYLTATITVVDNSAVGSPGHLENFTDEVQIKVRGNSTSNAYIKKLPYRLKFASKSTAPDGVAHKHDLLGYGYSKRNWTLLANAGDKSMLRNAVTYHLGRYVGMQFCPGYKFVDLVISGMYRGTYQVSDHPEVGTDRVEIDEATGWFMEHVSWTTMAEEPYIVGYPETVCIKSPDADDLTDEELNQLKSDMSSYLTAWRNGFTSGNWRSYNDVVSFINYYIATEITGDWDAYFVFKTAKEANSDKMLWPMLWDKDLAYGNWTDNTQLVEYFNQNANFAGYFTNSGGLLEDKWFLKLAKEKIDALIEDGLADKLCADIDRIAASIENTRLQNYAKYTYSLTSASVGERYLFPEYETHVSTLKEWIRARIPTVQSELQIRIDAVGGVDDLEGGEGGEGGETVTEGLTYLGQGVKWNDGEYVYTYQGSSNTMLEDAVLTISFDQTPVNYYGLYVDTQPYNAWKEAYGPSVLPISITLTAEDVATLKQNGYKFTIVTRGATISSVTLSGGIGGGGGDDPTPVVRGQLTDVPTIYIDTEGGAAISSTDAYTPASIQVFDNKGTLSEFTEDMGNLAIRGRGTTSWTNTDKKSYRLRFIQKHKHDLMGKGYAKRNWTLLANAGDKSLLRNALTSELGKAAGLPFTPGYCFVDLFLNGEYQGTYQVSDYVQADADRVNVDEDTGWLLQMGNEDEIDQDNDLFIAGTSTKPWVNIKNPEPLSEDEENLKSRVSAFFNQLWSDNSGAYLDQGTFVNWYICSEILGGYESLSSIFAYKEDAGEALFFGPLWNNELSYDNSAAQHMSSSALMSDINTANSYEGLIFNSAKASAWKNKLEALWEQEWFRTAVSTRWNELYNGGTDDLLATLLSKVTTIERRLQQTQAKNFSSTDDGGAGWSLTGAGLTGVSAESTYTSHAEAVSQVRTYLGERFAYLDNKFEALANSMSANVLLGDANDDGIVSITDVTYMVDYILGNATDIFNLTNADTNKDKKIDVTDVTNIVDIILSNH